MKKTFITWGFSTLLLGACATSPPGAKTPEPKIVFGEAGPDRMPVEVGGGYAHPGIYWLPKGTKLSVIIERAQINTKFRGEFDSDPVILVTRTRNGKEEQHRFKVPLSISDDGAAFVLEDGDLVRTSTLMF